MDLFFASKEDSLKVRRFSVHEAMCAPFVVNVWARSPNEDLDLETIVGKPAGLRVVPSLLSLVTGHFRLWTGVCSHMEQMRAETSKDGQSTYFLRIVPGLWLLKHRKNHRIFQHETIPKIVAKILGEWKIEPIWKIDDSQYKKLEFRVQYGESDFEFVSRMLEEAGIAYYFQQDDKKGSRLVFCDKPQANDPRAMPIGWVDRGDEGGHAEKIYDVRIAQDVRPGKLTLRDFDFRRKPDYQLLGEAPVAKAPEDFYEQYQWAPSYFLLEPGKGGGDTPNADDKGIARWDDKAGKDRATRMLESKRASRRTVNWGTNALDLVPGVVFSMLNHPRSDLGVGKKLVVTDFTMEGTTDGTWSVGGSAHFADVPYRPVIQTPKPTITGVQSAIVVGPKGEEIHTDEFGRVRVQFHWDREHHYDADSSCWIRVSQGWAGHGFGMINLPRIGQEVLVGFLEGDPDQPVVVGRVYNNTTRVPYKLPDHKTKSTWKSNSSPHSDGFNEIMFEDAKGNELVYIQAQKNLQKLVKANETERTGANRTISVGANRSAVIGAVDSTVVGTKHTMHIAQANPPPPIPPTGLDMSDKKISYTTGEATIAFDGPDITLEAKGTITIKSTGGDVIILGGPAVKINCP
jgi:type VI secretion system secreted protein VgrG